VTRNAAKSFLIASHLHTLPASRYVHFSALAAILSLLRSNRHSERERQCICIVRGVETAFLHDLFRFQLYSLPTSDKK
jgi:hypothetical protein